MVEVVGWLELVRVLQPTGAIALHTLVVSIHQ